MFFDAKFFTLLVFVSINFALIFWVKTRTTTVISLILMHLVALLFFSLSIANYNSFKEIVLSLIIYSMVILFLISNYNPIRLSEVKSNKIKSFYQRKLFLMGIFLIFLAFFLASFLIVKNLPQIAEFVYDKKFSSHNQQLIDPAISGIPRFNEEEKIIQKTDILSEIQQRKKARLKDKLADNFLLKHFSDIILITSAAIALLLILSPKNNHKMS